MSDIVARLIALGREHPDADAGALAAQIMEEHPDLMPLVVREIEHGQRSAVRENTAAVFGALWHAQNAGEPISLPAALGAFRELFPSTIALGDGVRVTVKDSTIDHWQQRRSMLLRDIAGLQREVAVCDTAIALLADHPRGTTLGDL